MENDKQPDAPTRAQQQAQGKRCPCGGSDEYCPCQNVVFRSKGGQP